MRENHDLSHDVLLAKLLEINREQCEPPLPTEEVAGIARSVSGNTNVQSGRQKRKVRKTQVEFYVSATADPIPVADLLQKQVSVYQSCLAKTPLTAVTIGGCLETFRTGGNSKELIDAIRKEPEKEKRSDLKKKLHAVVFGSEPQEERKAATCTPNGIIVLDFDGIPAEEMGSAKEAIEKIDYVFAVCLSAKSQRLRDREVSATAGQFVIIKFFTNLFFEGIC